MPHLRFLAVLAAVAGLALAAPPAVAQTSTGNIRGYVREASGAPVPSVQIVARDIAMGTVRTTTSNADGFYYLAGLRPAQYELSTRRIGFEAQTRPVTVQIGQTLTADFALTQTATQLSAVQVVATNEIRTSEVGGNITRAQLQNLPNFERNILDFAKLVPGVTATAVNSTDKKFAAGGQPAEAVNLFVDGATYKNDILQGGIAGQDASKGNPFPQGAVQEFRVVTQNYKAEYQKAASAIITATTRSGGNLWEGDAFAYGVGKSWAAKDAFSSMKGLSRPVYQRLQAGGSVGGPLVKDKLFLFGTYELNARDEPAYITLGPQAANAPAGLDLAQFLGQKQQQFREHLGFAKLTWAKSDRSTFDFSGNLRHDTDFRGFGGQTSFQASENMKIDVLTGIANWKYAGDRWLNEAQVNAQHFVWEPTPTNPNLIGRNYIDLLRIGGKDTRQDFTQNRLSLRDDISRGGVRWGGEHAFKGGGSVDFLTYESIKELTGNPVFNYRPQDNYAFPFQAQFGFGNPKIATHNTQIGAYIQDDWTVTPKLVLNLGVRWDVETNPINNGYVTPRALADSLTGPLAGQFYIDRPIGLRPDGTCCVTQRVNVIQELGGFSRYISNGRSSRPIYWGEIQPRLGASYDVGGNGRTVVFGGAGIYYDRNYWNTLLDEQYRRQYKVLTVNFNQTGPDATCPNCVAWDPKYYDPATLRTLAGTAGLPEVFLVANDLRPPRTYQFSAGVRQGLGNEYVSLSYNGVRGRNYMNFVKATPWGGLGPNYAQAFITDDRVKTWYDALQLMIERQMFVGMHWGGSLAYTFARADQQGNSTDIFWDFNDAHPTVADMPRTRAPNNQAHTIVANGIVRLPYDFLFSGIATLGSGLTTNATNATNGYGYGHEFTYVYTPPGQPFLGIGHVFSTTNVDLRLEKDFPTAEQQHVGLVIDLFNAFNNANFGCYSATIPPTGQTNTAYGQPFCAGLGRRIQVGLRYGLRQLQPASERGTR